MKKLLLILFAIYANFALAQVQNGDKQSSSEKSEKIYEYVEKIAEFPGGMNAFRDEFMKNFKTRKVNGTGKVSCEIVFVIERDGTLDDVKISGSNSSFNAEADRAIKKIKQKWSPAELNSVKVRYRYRMPIAMIF